MNAAINAKNKCKDCVDRHPGCHDRCDIYKAFRKELDDFNKKRQDISHENAPFVDKRQRALKVMRQKGRLK